VMQLQLELNAVLPCSCMCVQLPLICNVRCVCTQRFDITFLPALLYDARASFAAACGFRRCTCCVRSVASVRLCCLRFVACALPPACARACVPSGELRVRCRFGRATAAVGDEHCWWAAAGCRTASRCAATLSLCGALTEAAAAALASLPHAARAEVIDAYYGEHGNRYSTGASSSTRATFR